VVQFPQWLLSFERSSQVWSGQSVEPFEQATHWPAWHPVAPLQMIPQPPQFFGSTFVGTHLPLQ
jgi:hypothetical protein